MKFSLISDMHVDFPQPKTPYAKLEPVVVVAGDTSNGLDGLKFLQKLKHKGFNVLSVDGNHEHYRNDSQGRSAAETTSRFREEYPKTAEVDGVPFVSANGWYHISSPMSWFAYMNDGQMSAMSSNDVNVQAHNDAEYIRQTLEDWKNRQITGVVVTHTAPCLETLNPEFAGHYSNEWYWNPLMEQLLKEYAPQIRVWCHGHSHAKADKTIHGVRVVCNPRGYPGENPDWEPLTIEV